MPLPAPRPPARPRRRGTWRAARVVAAALAFVVAGAPPAGADPAGPSDFRSEVTEIVPPTDVVAAEVRGGDSFLQLEVEPGHLVVVEGYSGEPYLRFRPDGTVERNARSEATYLNDDRLAQVEVPAVADNDAEPEWETVADGGTYAWHDHRIHWMGSATPNVERGQRIFDPWRVPITVDGDPAEIRGILTFEPAVSPLPWVAGAAVVAALLAWLGRRAALRSAAAVLAVASAAAVVVGRFELAETPGGEGNVALWALPAVALAAALVGVVRARATAGVVAVLAAVAALSGWALLRFTVLLEPVLPTALPEPLDRGAVALALGAAVGAAYLALTSGVLALPELADDDDE